MSVISRIAPAPALLAALALPVAIAPSADAVTTTSVNCRVVQYRVLMGIDYGPLHVRRTCARGTGAVVSGSSNLAAGASTVTTGPSASRALVAETTVHELTHQVDWRTTNTYRKKLYAYLGVRTSSGTFWSVPSPALNWDGRSLAVWASDPHERLAESVVACAGGTPRVPGMKLVPKAQCRPFLATYRAAIRAAH